MRKIRIIVYLIVIAKLGIAQSVEKSFEDTTLWHMNSNYTWTEGPGGPVHFENFNQYKMIFSDTLISDTLFQKLFSCNSNFNTDSYSFVGYFKSIGKKVYYGTDSENMELMYDYNLNVGDTFRFNSFNNPWEQTSYLVEVTSVDSININGEYRKRITFEEFPYDEWYTGVYVVWVEGIGDYNYGLVWDYGLILYCAPMGNSSIVCFSENGNSIIGNCNLSNNTKTIGYKNKDIEVYPNPFSDVLNFDKLYGNFNIKIYNLKGELIFQKNINAPTKLYLNYINNGVYLLEVIDKEKIHYRKKIIKYCH